MGFDALLWVGETEHGPVPCHTIDANADRYVEDWRLGDQYFTVWLSRWSGKSEVWERVGFAACAKRTNIGRCVAGRSEEEQSCVAEAIRSIRTITEEANFGVVLPFGNDSIHLGHNVRNIVISK